MRSVTLVAVVAGLLLHASVALAHRPDQPPHQQYRIGDLALESGEVIKDFSISYVTHYILGFLAARSPEMYRYQFTNQADVLPWLKAQEDAQISLFDANDWIYQTWAYDAHDVGTTPGMNDDYVKALRSVKAKTLIMVGQKDLLNPEWEPIDAARYIRDVRVVTIRPEAITGHASAGGFFPADVDILNTEIGAFLDVVTNHGAKLRQ
jgi:homoserine O-acetyltransferase/O-succinyltransferase